MQIPRVAIILAAGIGRRLNAGLPKTLVKVGGKTILESQLELLADIEEVRLVVGFREMDVINHAASLRKDIVFVRNKNFFDSGPAASASLAARGLSEAVLLLDGDTLISKDSFSRFLANLNTDRNLIAVTQTKTEQPVCVNLSQDQTIIYGFCPGDETPFEWCGLAIVHSPSSIFATMGSESVFSLLEPGLPSDCCEVVAYEIDTAQDLVNANEYFNFI
jgi:choline kinase